MKRIMVISEHDHTEPLLAQIADNLFTHENRQVTVCNVEFVDCRIGSSQYHAPVTRDHESASAVFQKAAVYPEYLPVCVERLEVHSCTDLIARVKERQIDTVILPVSISNESEWGYYRNIAASLRKLGGIRILGVIVD